MALPATTAEPAIVLGIVLAKQRGTMGDIYHVAPLPALIF
jgi:hypothetical protein